MSVGNSIPGLKTLTVQSTVANYNSTLSFPYFKLNCKITHMHVQINIPQCGLICCECPDLAAPLCVHQVFYVSDLFKPRVKPATPPPSPIKKELLPSSDIIERNNHHNMV